MESIALWSHDFSAKADSMDPSGSEMLAVDTTAIKTAKETIKTFMITRSGRSALWMEKWCEARGFVESVSNWQRTRLICDAHSRRLLSNRKTICDAGVFSMKLRDAGDETDHQETGSVVSSSSLTTWNDLIRILIRKEVSEGCFLQDSKREQRPQV